VSYDARLRVRPLLKPETDSDSDAMDSEDDEDNANAGDGKGLLTSFTKFCIQEMMRGRRREGV
jgi:hypothetical protein